MLPLLAVLALLVACAGADTGTAAAQASVADPSVAGPSPAGQSAAPPAKAPAYETRAAHDPDGIGRFYLGREIAQVMGYQGAGWLERPERIAEERPDQVVEQMMLKPTDVVADLGAGTGYFSFRIAPVVKQGTVFAVDLQAEMLSIIGERIKQRNVSNIVRIRSTETDTTLPDASVDVVLMVDVYHEFAYPYEMMQSVVKALKPGGRVVQIEYRGGDPTVPIKRLHTMTVEQCRREMAAVGLRWKETKSFLPQQHFIVFEKPS
jgi:SAM-dependent methyltransferase